MAPRSGDEGGSRRGLPSRAPSTIAFGDGPPPRPGEEFGASALRLAGFAGAVLGWAPDAFWRATPAEVAAVVGVMAGEVATPPDAGAIARLREAFPDG